MARAAVEQWDAGYPRVSTDMQLERDALQNQVQALEAYAAAHGLTLRRYPEAGVSAKDTDRPQLQELLADVRAGRVRSVIVTKLDRISRSLADLLDLMRTFEAHGVKFVSLRDNIDTAGPVGRFMLHILGAIAELERAITAERVAEDMKLRARRGKWNGGLAPYGRRMEDGHLTIVPDEAVVLRQMRELLLRTRTWRGVAVALNRQGFRTRGWEPVEREGRVVRKGHAPAEWTSVSVKSVLLQPINAGTLVYNRRTVKGKTAVPRPAEEHVIVEGFCEPIFTREEMDELLRVAAEIEGTPPGTAVSPHLLSGLVECACGTKMYGIHSSVTTKRGRYRVGYYRCRRASHKGTCAAKQVPAAVVERVVIDELRRLGLDREHLTALAGEAQATLEAGLRPLLERRAAATAERERIKNRLDSLLELAEERLITKQEYAARKARLEGERATVDGELGTIEDEIAARAVAAIDVAATMQGLRRLGEVFDELLDVTDRRRLLATCLNRVILSPRAIELRVVAHPLLLAPAEGGDGAAKVPSQFQFAPAEEAQDRAASGQSGGEFPRGFSGADSEDYGICERMGAHASANTIVPTEVQRELVITVPLPHDKGRRGDGRPKVHRFRSHWLELGQRLRDFRACYGVTQAEVAQAVGSAGPSAVAQWERAINVPEGIRRERLVELLEGRRWPELRAAAIAGEGMPASWERAARWYRRASREQRARETVGVVVAKVLDGLQAVASLGALRERYCGHDGEWVHTLADRYGLGEAHRSDLRRLEDAAYGLRWLELAGGLRFDLRRSLVPQLPLSLLGAPFGRAAALESATGS